MHKIRTLLALGSIALLWVACSGEEDASSSVASSAPPTAAPTTVAEVSTTATGAPAETQPTVRGPIAGAEYADGQVAISQGVAEFVIATVQGFGEDGLDPSTIAAVVEAVYPELGVSGYAVNADPSTVSIHSTQLDDKDVAGPENPYVFAVAVQDTAGTCTGMVAFGYPTADQTFVANGLSACNAGAVVEEFAAEN
jgi:hypothetical protein